MAAGGAGGSILGGRQLLKPYRLAIVLPLIFCFPFAANAQARDSTARTVTASVPRDSFVGLDKPKHFLLSFFIQSASFASLQAAGADRRPAMLGAVAITASFAIGREIHDRKAKGLFSIGDLFWDALGAGAASMMLRHTYR